MHTKGTRAPAALIYCGVTPPWGDPPPGGSPPWVDPPWGVPPSWGNPPLGWPPPWGYPGLGWLAPGSDLQVWLPFYALSIFWPRQENKIGTKSAQIGTKRHKIVPKPEKSDKNRVPARLYFVSGGWRAFFSEFSPRKQREMPKKRVFFQASGTRLSQPSWNNRKKFQKSKNHPPDAGAPKFWSSPDSQFSELFAQKWHPHDGAKLAERIVPPCQLFFSNPSKKVPTPCRGKIIWPRDGGLSGSTKIVQKTQLFVSDFQKTGGWAYPMQGPRPTSRWMPGFLLKDFFWWKKQPADA